MIQIGNDWTRIFDSKKSGESLIVYASKKQMRMLMLIFGVLPPISFFLCLFMIALSLSRGRYGLIAILSFCAIIFPLFFFLLKFPLECEIQPDRGIFSTKGFSWQKRSTLFIPIGEIEEITYKFNYGGRGPGRGSIIVTKKDKTSMDIIRGFHDNMSIKEFESSISALSTKIASILNVPLREPKPLGILFQSLHK